MSSSGAKGLKLSRNIRTGYYFYSRTFCVYLEVTEVGRCSREINFVFKMLQNMYYLFAVNQQRGLLQKRKDTNNNNNNNNNNNISARCRKLAHSCSLKTNDRRFITFHTLRIYSQQTLRLKCTAVTLKWVLMTYDKMFNIFILKRLWPKNCASTTILL